MPPVINTGLLTKDARSEFLNRFELTEAETLYQQLAMRIASTKDSESYRWLGTVPQMREFGTGRVAKGLRAESYDVANLKYESTLEVDRDELADDQTSQIKIRIGELAQRAATHKDYLIGLLLASGATTGFNSYDGVTFFNDAHVSGVSGNQDNTLTAAIVNKDAPTTAEFRASLMAAIAAMLSFKDDQGAPMMLNEKALICLVPTSMLMTAREAVNAAIIASTSNIMAGAADVRAFPYLSATDTWYLLKTDGIVKPFIWQDREPIEFGSQTEGSSEEFLREKYYYGVRARYRVTYGYWQYAVRYVFTTA